MIEQFCIIIIKELGATGLLIMGLYWVIGKYLKKLSGNVETLNHNSTEMLRLIKDYTQNCHK